MEYFQLCVLVVGCLSVWHFLKEGSYYLRHCGNNRHLLPALCSNTDRSDMIGDGGETRQSRVQLLWKVTQQTCCFPRSEGRRRRESRLCSQLTGRTLSLDWLKTFTRDWVWQKTKRFWHFISVMLLGCPGGYIQLIMGKGTEPREVDGWAGCWGY